jgi:alpha-D-ribose 1-methylphosphonate 5-triphosphate synthase subunit PhnH
MRPAPPAETALALADGFADPVHDSQAAFRAIMRAMATPGRVETLATALEPPAPLGIAAAATCLALLDADTPMWLSPVFRDNPAVVDFLRFHTGAPLAPQAGAAAFALIDWRNDRFEPGAFAQGTAAYPDRSTTVIAACDGLDGEGSMVLSGPGIRGRASFGVMPEPAGFRAAWKTNRATFPLGIDLVLTAGRDIACLPRTTVIDTEGR